MKITTTEGHEFTHNNKVSVLIGVDEQSGEYRITTFRDGNTDSAYAPLKTLDEVVIVVRHTFNGSEPLPDLLSLRKQSG